MNKPKSLRERVKDLLRETEPARDDIRLCVMSIWKDEMDTMGRKPDTFMRDYFNGNYTSDAKIERAWRHIQREDSSLRGKNWYQRQERGRQVRIERAQERDAEIQRKIEAASIASDEQPEPVAKPKPKQKSFIQRLFGI